MMRLDRRITVLEALLQPQAAEPWTTWQQDRLTADLFHCWHTGETARWGDLADRPRVTLIEYVSDYKDTGQPARFLHLPGVTRTYVGVGRDA
jgi:hypothetical protein